ncbi:WD40 repeat-containing protein, putative [Bodo saltans]|uniref:WD40 repeat-containing protein, putative n=1 Tax=Bodo saltans TaxID=75058 RepID=A0A0S4JCI3_BODSA|nr:WD40 repeat-containing protein, putative [Bodo saltans]|eukprot:CUG86009.1 WD40 repeat-containing protein, putative [Bodo saltans]
MQEILDSSRNGYSLRLSLPFLPPPAPQRLTPKRTCALLLHRYASASSAAVAVATSVKTEKKQRQSTTTAILTPTSPNVKPRAAVAAPSATSSTPSKKKRQLIGRSGVLFSNMTAECIASFMIPSETIVVASMNHIATLKMLQHDIVQHHTAEIPEEESGSGGEFSSVAALPAITRMPSSSSSGVALDATERRMRRQNDTNGACIVAAFGLGIAAYTLPRLRLQDEFDGAGHSDAVLALDVTQDGLHMATGSRDCGVIYWSRTEGPLRYMVGHTDWVRFVKFCSSGTVLPQQLLFSASDDGTVALWDPARGTRLFCLDAFEGQSIRSFDVVEVSNQQQQRSSGQNATHQRTFSGYAATVSIALTLEGSPIYLFELVVPSSTSSSPSSSSIAHSRTNSLNFPRSLSGGGGDDPLGRGGATAAPTVVITAYSLEPRGTIEAPHSGTLTALRFTPNGKWIVTAAEDETVAVCSIVDGGAVLWRSTSLVTKRRCISFMNTISSIRVLCCPPQTSVLMLCACSSDGHVLLWSIDPREGGKLFERTTQLQIGALVSIDVAKGIV